MHIIFWEVWFGHSAKLGICRLSDKVCCSYDREVRSLVERALVLESADLGSSYLSCVISVSHLFF